MRKAALFVAGIIFALMAILHITRLYFQFPIIINSMLVPLWVNWVGLVVSGTLTIWMFTALKKK